MGHDDPTHYKMDIEPADFILLNNLPAWAASVIKYACRAGRKKYEGLNMDKSEIEDCRKIIKYAQFRINMLEGRLPTQEKDKKNAGVGNHGWHKRRLRHNKNHN
tara:strand:- start:121 stop:432 length:312 start_codon:yes stop_codon:yes gene_type:complete